MAETVAEKRLMEETGELLSSRADYTLQTEAGDAE